MIEEKTEFTLNEIKNNNGVDGKPLWIIVRGNVYDVTKFDHPAGKEMFTSNVGYDIRNVLENEHGDSKNKEINKFLIGTVKKGETILIKETINNSANNNEQDEVSCKKGKWFYLSTILTILVTTAGVGYYFYKKNKRI